jgi:hypothetical protein
MIYLDSSVALAYLLAEDRYPSNALWDQSAVSASLLESEVWNRINARRLQDSHGDAVRGLIGRIGIIEMLPPIPKRALDPFPVPIRNLAPSIWQPSSSSASREQAFSLLALTSEWLVLHATLEFPSGTAMNDHIRDAKCRGEGLAGKPTKAEPGARAPLIND